jgi:transketolase
MAAGLAMEGFMPYVNTIAPFFTRRANEQIAVDLCLHNLPVRLIANGGGVVYAQLGPTHMAIEDMSSLRALPNMTVVSVCDAEEMRRFMDASLDWPGPIYIRLAKGGDPIVSSPEREFAIGKAISMREPGDALLVTTGIMLSRALAAADELKQENISCGILHMHTIKPFDHEALLRRARSVRLVVTIEEHTKIGGLGSAVLECLAEAMDRMPTVRRMGIPDAFPHDYGSQDNLLESYGLTAPMIAKTVRDFCR